jgi:uncharacterized protein (DUF1697 family)
MPRYLALLRAINVGGHVVKMTRLRELFQELGFENVETFIASGNVSFEATSKSTAALEKKIESHLQAALGYEVKTFIRTPAQLCKIADYEPFPKSKAPSGGGLYVAFLSKEPSAEAKEKVLALRTAIDEFHVHERELYWLCHKKSSESLVPAAQLKNALGISYTMRNMTTVRKMAKKYSKPS